MTPPDSIPPLTWPGGVVIHFYSDDGVLLGERNISLAQAGLVPMIAAADAEVYRHVPVVWLAGYDGDDGSLMVFLKTLNEPTNKKEPDGT